jgi:metallo-beta-lactamase class B
MKNNDGGGWRSLAYPESLTIWMAFLFDTPVTEAQIKDLVTWIRDSLKLKIVGFVPNHWHKDCIGGLAYLQSLKIKSYANQKTIDIAKAKHLPVPVFGFNPHCSL